MRPSRSAHPIENLFRQWRYLFLLIALLTLLVVHPIAAGIGGVGLLFDALFALVMLMLMLALSRTRSGGSLPSWRCFLPRRYRREGIFLLHLHKMRASQRVTSSARYSSSWRPARSSIRS